jgi:hypothetical protein
VPAQPLAGFFDDFMNSVASYQAVTSKIIMQNQHGFMSDGHEHARAKTLRSGSCGA